VINLLNKKRELYILLFLITLSGFIILGSGESQNDQAFPIKIKFKQHFPPKSVKIEENYVLHIEWKNRDNYRSYNGQFVFKVNLKDRKIVVSDLKCIYREQIIEAVEANDCLEFWLPCQEFPCLDSDYVEVTIQYFSSGEYLWDIAIAQY